MATVQPIAPHEVADKKLETIPDAVIRAFNGLLTKKYNGYDATIKQEEAIMAIRAEDETISRQEIFDNHWLDVEDIYRSIGWDVTFDKPGYNESYSARYVFKKKK